MLVLGQTRALERLPKLCGADIELGNFILGVDRPWGSGGEAARLLLREFDGHFGVHADAGWEREENIRSASHWSCGSSDYQRTWYAQDWGRKFLASNGGCVYIDLEHLELCLPEVVSAFDHVAAWHAMLRIAQRALAAANRDRPRGRSIQVLVNNSDGQGNSYGAHINFMVTRRAWDSIFQRRLHQALFLASFQASSIIFTGQGKVGAENGVPAVPYQISQRADFFETLIASWTTYNRPLVNSRDEPLCGPAFGATAGARPARLHVIFFDNTLCPVACLLKVGVMQIVLAMIEAGCTDPGLILDDPLGAVVHYSHDPTLRARARLASGRELTAVELQWLFLERARAFVAAGGCEGIVPRAGEILALWEDTLHKLQAGDFAALSRRLDWVLKYCFLQAAMIERPALTWTSPEIKHWDHLYSSLDEQEGLYWRYQRRGFVEAVVPEARIAQLVDNPPEDTRAWTRAALLRRAGPDAVDSVNWDSIRFKTRGGSYWSRYRTLDLAHPLRFTRAEVEPLLERDGNLDDLLDALEDLGRDFDPGTQSQKGGDYYAATPTC